MENTSVLRTQICEDRDFVEWHRGCLWCAVWLVRLEKPEFQSLMTQARCLMAKYLLPRYQRQPHVTLAYRGLLGEQGSHPSAEYGQLQLVRDVKALQRAKLQPWVLQAGGFASFASVPYIAVQEQPALFHAHNALEQEVPYPEWKYVPHITLGHYACSLSISQALQPLLGSGLAQGVWRESVRAIWLARYRTNDIAGSLSFEGCFDLRTQHYRPQPDALLKWSS